MTDPDTALAATQANVQSYFAATAETLLSANADQIAWEEWVASVRFSSEETWYRCNAFLLAHTLGRFLARSVPPRPDVQRDQWVESFVAAVAAGDTSAELVLWTSMPVENPTANDAVRYSAVVWTLCQTLRTARPIDGARPELYPHSVWFDDDKAGRHRGCGR